MPVWPDERPLGGGETGEVAGGCSQPGATEPVPASPSGTASVVGEGEGNTQRMASKILWELPNPQKASRHSADISLVFSGVQS
jgi:hypothetical protein